MPAPVAALAALPQSLASPASPPAAHADTVSEHKHDTGHNHSIHLNLNLYTNLLAPSASPADTAFLAAHAPAADLAVVVDRRAGSLTVDRQVVDLGAVDGGIDVLASPLCNGERRVGAYAGKVRVGLEVVPECVAEEGEEGGVRVGLTYAARLATIGGLPVEQDSATPFPLLHLSLTYSASSPIPSITVTRLTLPAAPHSPPSLLPTTLRAPHIRPWLQRHLLLPLSTIIAHLSSLILSLSALGAILYAVWAACEARREGAIRLREAGEAEGGEAEMEEVWVVPV